VKVPLTNAKVIHVIFPAHFVTRFFYVLKVCEKKLKNIFVEEKYFLLEKKKRTFI